MYKIKEVSQKLEMSEHTIRYYTDIGLVPHMERDENNVRIFNEKAVNWLRGLKYLKGCGMSIQALQDYVKLCLDGDETVTQRYDIIIEQKKEIDKKLDELQKCSDYLTEKVAYYEEVMDGKRIDNSNPDNW